jgi:hypothetical protein
MACFFCVDGCGGSREADGDADGVKENVSGGNGVGNRKPTIIRPSPSYQKDGNKQAGEMDPGLPILPSTAIPRRSLLMKNPPTDTV